MINLIPFQKKCFFLIVSLLLLSCGQKKYTHLKQSPQGNDLGFYHIQDTEANLEYKVYFDGKNEKCLSFILQMAKNYNGQM